VKILDVEFILPDPRAEPLTLRSVFSGGKGGGVGAPAAVVSFDRRAGNFGEVDQQADPFGP
jgi:hypothetical protein